MLIKKDEIIKANLRLHKAREDYRSAKTLLEKGLYRAANDRAYFCMYHAANAVCALDGVNPKYGVSVRNYFKLRCADSTLLPGFIDPYLCEILEYAAKSRFSVNFDDCYAVGKKETLINVENAEIFLEAIENFAAQRVKCEYTADDCE